jgi:hypothetical protein
MQPIVIAPDGIIRFKANAIVKWLLEQAERGRKVDMNDIAQHGFADEDRRQFAQLIGYSIGGYNELSYVDDASAGQANEIAAKLAEGT